MAGGAGGGGAWVEVGGGWECQTRTVRRNGGVAVLEIWAVTLEPGGKPGGTVTISCAGGGDRRASVECVDAVLADVSEPWPTPRTRVGKCSVKNGPIALNTPDEQKPSGNPSASMAA